MGSVIKQASKVIKRISGNAVKAARAATGSPQAATSSPQAVVQKAVAEQKAKVNPASAKRGVSAGEMESPMAKAARRRGRRSNVMSGSRGVMGSASTTKKTLLGG